MLGEKKCGKIVKNEEYKLDQFFADMYTNLLNRKDFFKTLLKELKPTRWVDRFFKDRTEHNLRLFFNIAYGAALTDLKNEMKTLIENDKFGKKRKK